MFKSNNIMQMKYIIKIFLAKLLYLVIKCEISNLDVCKYILDIINHTIYLSIFYYCILYLCKFMCMHVCVYSDFIIILLCLLYIELCIILLKVTTSCYYVDC